MSAVVLCKQQISRELGSRRSAVLCSRVWEAASHPVASRVPWVWSAGDRAVSLCSLRITQSRHQSDGDLLERCVYLYLFNLALVKGEYEVIGSFSLHQNPWNSANLKETNRTKPNMNLSEMWILHKHLRLCLRKRVLGKLAFNSLLPLFCKLAITGCREISCVMSRFPDFVLNG